MSNPCYGVAEGNMPELEVAGALEPIKEKLESIMSRLEKIKDSGSVFYRDLQPFQDELREVDEQYVDEKVSHDDCHRRALEVALSPCDRQHSVTDVPSVSGEPAFRAYSRYSSVMLFGVLP
jgi:hypothetical protein